MTSVAYREWIRMLHDRMYFVPKIGDAVCGVSPDRRREGNGLFTTFSVTTSTGIYSGFSGRDGRYSPNRFLQATRWALNLSSGENRAG